MTTIRDLRNDSKELNIITVIRMSPSELVRKVYPLQQIPVVGPNRPVEIEDEMVPLLSSIANEASFIAELHAVCVSLKAQYEVDDTINIRKDKDLIALKAKVDILYRALQASNRNWDAVSRVLTVLNSRPHSRLIKHDGAE